MATATTTKSRTSKAAAAAAEAPVEEVEAAPADAPKQESESQKRNRLRNEAERVIINRHKAEFEDYATELFAENGLKFNKRMSEEQKAEAKVKELIAKHPELKDALLASLLPAQESAQAPAAEVQAPVYEAPEPSYTPEDQLGEGHFGGEVDDPWAGRPAQ